MQKSQFSIKTFFYQMLTMWTIYRLTFRAKWDRLFGYTTFMGWGKVAKYRQLLNLRDRELIYLRNELTNKEQEIKKFKKLAFKQQMEIAALKKSKETEVFPKKEETPPIDVMTGSFPPIVKPPLALPAPTVNVVSPEYGTPVDELSIERKVCGFRGPMPQYSDGWYEC